MDQSCFNKVQFGTLKNSRFIVFFFVLNYLFSSPLAFSQSQTPIPTPIQIPFPTPTPTTWQKTYGGESYDVANSILPTTDGGFIMAGYTRFFGAGESYAYLLKLDSDGNTKPYPNE